MWSPLIVLLVISAAFAWPELGSDGVPTGRHLDAKAYFSTSSKSPAPSEPVGGVPAKAGLPAVTIHTPVADLGRIAADTAVLLRDKRDSGDRAVHAGLIGELGYSLDDVIDTLTYIAEVAAQDAGKTKQRLHDPAFINANFDVVNWTPNIEDARAARVHVDTRIRLTRYLVYEAQGSETRTDVYNTALYAPPADDAVAPGTTELCAPRPAHLAYTRMDVYGGVFEPGGAAHGLAEPLVWLTREAANRALMQGTVAVKIGTEQRLYNVFRNNGIAYDRAIKDGNLQPRFWYFRQVDSVLGYALGDRSVPVHPRVAVAGDVYNLGLGKLIALRGSDGLRLVVLADTGGAFQPNLHQLDFYAGQFASHRDYLAATKHLDDRMHASVLVRKRPAAVP